MVLLQGTEACKRNLEFIQLNAIQLINNKLFRDVVKEPENKKDNQRKELERKEMVFLKKHSSDFRKNRRVAFGIPFKQRRKSYHG